MSFLNLENKNILVVGVANKKSVAFHIGKTLQQEGANVLYSVRTKERKKQIEKLVVPSSIYVCDVEVEEEIKSLKKEISSEVDTLHGLITSVSFAISHDVLHTFNET